MATDGVETGQGIVPDSSGAGQIPSNEDVYFSDNKDDKNSTESIPEPNMGTVSFIDYKGNTKVISLDKGIQGEDASFFTEEVLKGIQEGYTIFTTDKSGKIITSGRKIQDEFKASSDIIPEQATIGIPQVTTNANTGYGFYDEYGRIANADTAHEIANTTIDKEEELLQQHKETANEVEKLKGGYLEVIRPFVEKYPDLLDIKIDADGEPVVISNIIEGAVPGAGVNTRAVVFFKEGFARITGFKPLIEDERESLQFISPETLKQWKQIFSDDRPYYEVYHLTPVGLKPNVYNEGYTNMKLQKLGIPSLFKDFAEKPLEVLIQERNTKKDETLNANITPMKEELSDL